MFKIFFQLCFCTSFVQQYLKYLSIITSREIYGPNYLLDPIRILFNTRLVLRSPLFPKMCF
jgi:hypothetical protein